MSLQSRLARRNARLKRKLYDNAIRTLGYECKVVRLKIDENQYGDEEIEIVDRDTVVAIFDYPSDIPMFSGRSDSTQPSPELEAFYIYDLIPITARFRFQDNVAENDIIIRKFYDATESGEPMLQIYRIAALSGGFSTNLLTQRFELAPYNLDISRYPDLVQIIENFEDGIE